jgi:hypothetical protein
MSLSRAFTPALRSGLVVAAGAVLIVAPPVIGLSSAAAATGLAVGVIAVAITVRTRYSLLAQSQ